MMADGGRTFRDPANGDLVIDDGVEEVTQGKVTQHFENLATTVVEGHKVDELSSSISELISWDENGRQEWEELLAENTELLGLGPETQPDDSEYENSDTSDSTLMLTALIRFQSKALSAILPLPDRVCHTECALDLEAIDDEDQRDQVQEEADEAGRRVEKYLADYLLKRHKTYRADTDRILYEMGFHGLGIRKVWTDHSRTNDKVRIEQIPIEDLILSYDTKSMSCGRITHRIDMPTPELIRNIRNGTFRATDGLASGGTEEAGPLEKEEDRIHGITDNLMREGETHRIYEVYTELFLDSDPHSQGLARPYVITIHAASQDILSLRRNWQEGDPDEQPIERFVGYTFHPGKNAVLGMGLGHILANVTRALRRAQRRGLEAAYLQNHPSGYKLSSMKIRDGSSKLRPGEFQDIDTPTNDIRAALQLHPFEGPSPGLLQLADKMESNGRELGGIASIDFSQLMKAGIAAGPAMAAYDESTEFQTAIHARLYQGHMTELTLIMDRMREVHGNRAIPFGVNSAVHPGDLTLVNLMPIMQPGQISRQRKVLEAMAMLEAADRLPDIVDRRRAAEDYIKALGKPDVSLYLLPDPAEAPPPPPLDPISEYNNVLNEQPIRAGLQQNHQAHIDAHAAQMRMLQYSMLPPDKGEAAMAILAAHIAEHMGQQMMVEVAQRMGIPVEQLQQAAQDPAMEAQIAPAVAEEIVAIEEERRPADGEGERLQVEMVKGQNQQTVEQLKAQQQRQLQQMKQEHEKELQRMRDEAELERAIQDDETALEIAAMKDRNSAPTRAGGISS